MAYASLAQLKNYLGISVTSDDTLLTDLLARAQQAIDSYCHRSFEARTETRYYRQDAVAIADPFGYDITHEVLNPVYDVLYLDDDLLAVTTLTNGNGETIPSSGYWLEPRNGPPYWYIRLKSAYNWEFDTDGEISVAGTWGYATTAPDDIVHATVRLAAYFYRQKDAQVFDTTAMPEVGVITIPQGIPADVKLILNHYVRLI